MPRKKGREAAIADRASARRLLHAARHRRRIALRQVSIARERPERKIFAVAVVPKIEDARESGGREPLLLPEPVLALHTQQILDATGGCGVAHLPACHQAQQRPGGLRSRARRGLVTAIVEPIARAVLAP